MKITINLTQSLRQAVCAVLRYSIVFIVSCLATIIVPAQSWWGIALFAVIIASLGLLLMATVQVVALCIKVISNPDREE